MNILMINYEYPPIGGGAATFTRYLAQQIARREQHVTVFTTKFGELPQYERANEFLEIFRIPAYRKSQSECTIKGMVSFMLSGLWHIDRVLRSQKPDICLNFFGIPCGPIAWYVKKKYGIPYILCLRGGDVPGFSPQETGIYHKILAPLNRMIWAEAAEIVANSSGLKALAESFYKSKNIHVIYNGVDTDMFKPESSFRQSDVFRILFVGRLVPQKNLHLLFESIIPALLSGDREYSLQVTIVGDGPLKQGLISIARKNGTLENITFLDWVSREKLPKIYHAHDLFLFPSLYEGMSNTVLEAKACGLPVAGFRIAGNDELLEPEKDICVDKNDVEQLVDKIKAMWHQSQQKKDISDGFLQQFSMNHITEQFQCVIDEVRGVSQKLCSHVTG